MDEMNKNGGESCHHQKDNHLLRNLGIVLVLGALGYWLFTEHRAHTLAFLPYAFLLACPLMHIFMHRGHGGHK